MVSAVFSLIALSCGLYLTVFVGRKVHRGRRARRLEAGLEEIVELHRAGQGEQAERHLAGLDPTAAYLAQVGSALAEEGISAPARELLSRAESADRSSSGRLYFSAIGFSALGAREEALASLSRLKEAARLGAGQSLEMARLAIENEQEDLARDFYLRRLNLIPDDLETCCEFGEFLVVIDRAEEAIPVLEHGMKRLHRMLERGDHWITGSEPYEQLQDRLSAIHHEAVARSSSAEKAIEAHAALGNLDPKAGVNYTLLGYSALVDSQSSPRRVNIPTQEALEAAVESEMEPVSRLEDKGFFLLREHEYASSVDVFRDCVALERGWASLVGLGAALDASQYPPRKWLKYAMRVTPSVPRLEELCPSWEALTDYERGYMNLCVAPLAWAVEAILAAGGGLFIVSLDAKTTDRSEFSDVSGAQADDDGRRYDALGGMAVGAFSVTRAEELYKVNPLNGWTLAHEFGHQVLNVSSDEVWSEVEALLENHRSLGFVGTTYGLKNVHELFACGYERFAIRQALPDLALDEIHRCDLEHGLDAFFRVLGE